LSDVELLGRMPQVAEFPSIKARKLLAVLTREPLGYRIARQSGSHRHLRANRYPNVLFAFHDRQTIRPHIVRDILCRQVGLEEDEARRLL
jgi:predicted RNA binding protein YcfA (HicA-like mRNA interferase family)